MCGKGAQQTTQQSQQQTAPNPQAMQLYQDILSRAQGISNTPYQGYGGELVAGINPQQMLGIGNINAAQPWFGTATNMAYQAAQPIGAADIQQYMSPYTQNVVDATQRQFANMNAQQQSQVLGNAAAQGALGGNRSGVAQAALAGQQALAQDPTIAGLYNQGYSQALNTALAEQQAKLQGAYGVGNLAGQQLTGANAQIGAGTLQQQTQQQQDIANYQQFMNKLAFPYQQLGWLAGLGTGVGSQMGGTTWGNQTTTAPPPSIWGQLLGLGAMGLGAYGALKNAGGRVDGPVGVANYQSGGAVQPYYLPKGGSNVPGGADYLGYATGIPELKLTSGNPWGGSLRYLDPPKQQQSDKSSTGDFTSALKGLKQSPADLAAQDIADDAAADAADEAAQAAAWPVSADLGTGVADVGTGAASVGGGSGIGDLFASLSPEALASLLLNQGGRANGVAGYQTGGGIADDDLVSRPPSINLNALEAAKKLGRFIAPSTMSLAEGEPSPEPLFDPAKVPPSGKIGGGDPRYMESLSEVASSVPMALMGPEALAARGVAGAAPEIAGVAARFAPRGLSIGDRVLQGAVAAGLGMEPDTAEAQQARLSRKDREALEIERIKAENAAKARTLEVKAKVDAEQQQAETAARIAREKADADAARELQSRRDAAALERERAAKFAALPWREQHPAAANAIGVAGNIAAAAIPFGKRLAGQPAINRMGQAYNAILERGETALAAGEKGLAKQAATQLAHMERELRGTPSAAKTAGLTALNTTLPWEASTFPDVMDIYGGSDEARARAKEHLTDPWRVGTTGGQGGAYTYLGHKLPLPMRTEAPNFGAGRGFIQSVLPKSSPLFMRHAGGGVANYQNGGGDDSDFGFSGVAGALTYLSPEEKALFEKGDIKLPPKVGSVESVPPQGNMLPGGYDLTGPVATRGAPPFVRPAEPAPESTPDLGVASRGPNDPTSLEPVPEPPRAAPELTRSIPDAAPAGVGVVPVSTTAPAATGAARVARTALTPEPRGIRNKNPGNIEDGPFARSQPGYAGVERQGRFAVFKTLEDGTNAAANLLRSYGTKRDAFGQPVNTLNRMINRWAPASDGNDVPAYVQHVVGRTGIDPNATLDTNDPKLMRSIANAMFEHENGPGWGARASSDYNRAYGAEYPGSRGVAPAGLSGGLSGIAGRLSGLWNKSDQWGLPLMLAGARMAQAASAPGATLAGSIGAGGEAGIGAYMHQRQSELANQLAQRKLDQAAQLAQARDRQTAAYRGLVEQRLRNTPHVVGEYTTTDKYTGMTSTKKIYAIQDKDGNLIDATTNEKIDSSRFVQKPDEDPTTAYRSQYNWQAGGKNPPIFAPNIGGFLQSPTRSAVPQIVAGTAHGGAVNRQAGGDVPAGSTPYTSDWNTPQQQALLQLSQPVKVTEAEAPFPDEAPKPTPVQFPEPQKDDQEDYSSGLRAALDREHSTEGFNKEALDALTARHPMMQVMGVRNQVMQVATGMSPIPKATGKNAQLNAFIRGAAYEINPDLSEATYGRRQKTDAYYTTGVGGQQIVSFNRYLAHSASLLSIAERLHKLSALGGLVGYEGTSTDLNGVVNALTKRGLLGPKEAQNLLYEYELNRAAVAGEGSKVFAGTSQTALQDREHWMSTLDPSMPFDAIRKTIGRGVELGIGAIQQHQMNYDAGLRRTSSPREFLSPRTKKIFEAFESGTPISEALPETAGPIREHKPAAAAPAAPAVIPADKRAQAEQWLRDNPNDPRAPAVRRKLGQ